MTIRNCPLRLWFDATDLWGWSSPQLTGIQRVIATIFSELARAEPEMRLVRFDTASKLLITIASSDLPDVVRHYGGISASAELNVSSAPQAAHPIPTSIATQLGQDTQRSTGRRTIVRLLSLIHRWAPDEVYRGIEAYRLCRRTLRWSLYEWWLPVQAADPHQPPVPGNDVAAPPVLEPDCAPLPFRDGDVFLSLCLTWGNAGYWDAVSAARDAGATFVLLIHDISAILHPQWVLPGLTEVAIEWFHNAVRHSDLLIVTSEFQRREICTYMAQAGLPPRPMEVVRLGDDPPVLTVTAAEAQYRRDRCQLAQPFVLNVSGFYPRKNHHALYHVWRRLALELGDQCPVLVLVGERPRWPFDLLPQIERDPLTRDRILVYFDIQDEELAILYRRCLFTVYPSHYEGWGLPVAESLRLGRYCIASRVSSIPEIGGDLVDYVDPLDQMDLYRKVLRAIRDPGYIRRREQLIEDRYRPWSWRQCAHQLMERVDASLAKRRP